MCCRCNYSGVGCEQAELEQGWPAERDGGIVEVTPSCPLQGWARGQGSVQMLGQELASWVPLLGVQHRCNAALWDHRTTESFGLENSSEIKSNPNPSPPCPLPKSSAPRSPPGPANPSVQRAFLAALFFPFLPLEDMFISKISETSGAACASNSFSKCIMSQE